MASSDINNFSSSSPHRLPTLSASQALQNLSSAPRKPLSTGLRNLDALLQGRDYDHSSQDDLPGGISRGEVTEIYGPPAVGKTAFAWEVLQFHACFIIQDSDFVFGIRMQVSARVLRLGGSLIWVDASCQLVGSRLKEFFSNLQESQSQPTLESEPAAHPNTDLDNFHHFTTPTLPHLLALLTHQSTSFPPLETSLIIIDSVSTLFALAFPKTAEITDRQQGQAKKTDAAQWASSRRWAVMGDFMSKIGRLAATKNIAILLTSQTTTRIRSDTGAVLHPAISGAAWETGIGTRIVLFRDWIFQKADAQSSQRQFMPGVRFAGVVKAKGVAYEGIGKVATFRIEKDGLQEVKVDQADIIRNASPVLPATSLKRKRGEIADSQSEDEEAVASDQEFGWAGDEETLNAEELLD